MILPGKHTKIAESLFGLGGYILKFLDIPKSIDRVWLEFSRINNSKEFPAYHSFDNFILALDYLFIIGAIDSNAKGEIFNAALKSNS
jgi:hypothetical protein